jgi:hypothetical protein
MTCREMESDIRLELSRKVGLNLSLVLAEKRV